MEGVGEVPGEKTRIYVGGLGGGVTEDDLRKTFSALGEVVAVDVVRTKGRSFAYLDFLPSSDKSLPKLFSTYNGCMWKGGKLRLEKAKEHYLLRLNREWQEESSNSNNTSHTDPPESHDTLEKLKKLPPADKTQFRLFFPKLGKVKSLGQVGIGKHKYSFQRIPIPSIPTHFCDCEEHSVAFTPTKRKQSSEIENASDIINEQELEIMNSVMNKIFQRANPCKQETRKHESENGRVASMNPHDELAAVVDDDEDHLTDEEDNLIINVANGSDDMDLLGEMRSMMAKQEPVAKRLITSREKPKNVDDNQKKKASKRKSSHTEENNEKFPVIPETSRNSDICLDSREGNKTEVDSGTKQPGSNSLRSLKSTWKDLIGQTSNNSTFSISDIIASVPQEKEKKKPVHNKKRKLEGDENEDKLAASFPETTSSKSPVNKEPANELGVVDISIPDILANDSPEKEEKPTADFDVPIPLISQKTNESDTPPGAAEQKEEPRTDDTVALNAENKDENESGNSKDPAKHDEDVIRTARGESWRHKSSWTQLISATSNTCFSISQIVPEISFEKHQQQSESQPADKNLNTTCAAAPINNDQIPVAGVSAAAVKKNASEYKKSLLLRSLGSEETCPFMRTEESMKEWKKAKASLSGSLNKKKRSVNESA